MRQLTTGEFISRAKRILPAFLLIHFTHHLCTGILVPLLPLIRDDYTLDYLGTGLLVSAFSLVYGVAQLPMGGLADRTSKRWVLSLGLVGVAVSTLIIGVSGSYVMIIVLLVIMGIFGGTYHPVATPLISEYFPQQSRGTALGVHLIGGSGSFLLTPIFAGIVAQIAGWQTAFLLLPIPAFFAAALFLLLVKGESAGGLARVDESEGPIPSLWDIARLIGLLVAIAVVSQLISTGVNSFLPLYFVDQHGLEPTMAAMLMGLPIGAGIIGAPAGGALSDRIGRKPVILISVIATGPLLYLLTIFPFGAMLIGVILLFGLANSLRMPVMESLIMDVVPAARRSTIMGIYYFLTMEVGGLSAMLTGFLMDIFGLNQTFTLLALLAVASSVLVFLIRGRV